MDKDNNVNNVNNVKNMTKAERKREIANAVIRFKGEMTSAGDSLTRAAKIYADTIAKFGDSAGEAFRKEYPWVTTVTWTKLLRLAAGQIIPEMVLLSDRIYKSHEDADLETQRKMLGGKKTLRVVTKTMKVVDKPISDILPEEAKCLFKHDGSTRTVDEQLEFMKNTKKDPPKKDYEVCGEVLIVHRATRIGKCELVKILEQMK